MLNVKSNVVLDATVVDPKLATSQSLLYFIKDIILRIDSKSTKSSDLSKGSWVKRRFKTHASNTVVIDVFYKSIY